ncbi:hypothetical protein QQ045_018491 [Rhodiola kirilowii]
MNRLERIFEVFEAVVGGDVVETVICEECFFNGRETEWRVDEPIEEVQGSSESTQCVTETPLGKEVPCEPSLPRSGGKVKDSRKMISIREVSDCNWDATLKSFLQQNGKGSVGMGTKDQTGLVSIPVAQTTDKRADDSLSQEEAFSSSLGCLEGSSSRMVKKKPSLAREFAAKPHDYYKIAKRKESKEKVGCAETLLVSVREGLDEAVKKSVHRKEAEETVKFAKAIGIKASLPDEEVVQIFIKRDEERRRERERKERRN